MNCSYFNILAKLFEVIAVKQVVEVKYTANAPYSNYKAPYYSCYFALLYITALLVVAFVQ